MVISRDHYIVLYYTIVSALPQLGKPLLFLLSVSNLIVYMFFFISYIVISSSTKSYSIWPVILMVYKLSLWLCMARPFLFLTLLILDPNSLNQNINVYLWPLVDNLKLSWEDRVPTWDALLKKNFEMWAPLL